MKYRQEEGNHIPTSRIQNGYDINYPLDICRFDDNLPARGLTPVRDTKILKKLKQKCEEAKILWEASDQISFNNFRAALDHREPPEYQNLTHHKQFLVYLHLAVNYAKLLASDGRLARQRSLFVDRSAIYGLYIDSFNKVNYCLTQWETTYDISFCHPFGQLIQAIPPDQALAEMQSTEYKNAEALFIRTSNAERKKIVETIVEQWALHKNIVLHRLQVSTESFFTPDGSLGSDQFKSELNTIFERINFESRNHLLCALHSLYPSALSQAGLAGFEGTIGHLVLLFSRKPLAQNKNFFSFLRNPFSLIEGTSLGILPMDPAKGAIAAKR